MPYRPPLRSHVQAGAVVVILAALSLAAGCQSTAEKREVDDSLLRVGFGIGRSAKDNSVRHLTDLLYAESLLVRGWDGRQIGRLATNWRWENRGRALRLHLKEGVLLHDGTPVSPEIVAKLLTPRAAGAEWGFEQVTRVSAIEGNQILIELARPDLFLLNGLADRKIVHPDAPDIGTGPFRLIRRTPIVETRRFDRYHGGQSPLSGVQIITYDTPRGAWAALMRGEVDAAQEVSRDSVDFMEGSSRVATYPSIQPFYIPLVFNVRHGALGHVEVRRALIEALDRRAIIDGAMNGRGRLAESPIWPLHWAYTPHPNRYEYNPASAKARLDAAGFPLPAGGRAGELRKRFTLRCMVYKEDPQYERIAMMVQRQLFEIGVDLDIQLVDLATFGERAAKGDFDTFLIRTNAGRSMDFTYRFWRSGLPSNLLMQSSGYEGANHALDRLRSSTSDEEIRGSVTELARRFYEDAPAAFIAWLEVTRAVDSRFSVGDGAAEDPLYNIWRWRPVGKPGS
jgi:peptide/nickel transport system substrate-binding protein